MGAYFSFLLNPYVATPLVLVLTAAFFLVRKMRQEPEFYFPPIDKDVLQEQIKKAVEEAKNPPQKKSNRKRPLQKVRVLLLGDAQIGKSTFIQKLLGEDEAKEGEPTPELPAVYEPFTLSKDNIRVSLFDSSEATPEAAEKLQEHLKVVDFTLIFLDANAPSKDVLTKWVEKVTKIRKDDMPQMGVVANKSDKDNEENLVSESDMRGLAALFPRIGFAAEISTKTGKNMDQVFHIVVQTIAFPVEPLFKPSAEPRDLTDKCKEVLAKIYDNWTKGSDRLSDESLIEFQEVIWEEELDAKGIHDLKTKLSQQNPDFVNAEGVSKEGFIAFCKTCIEVGRIQLIWTLLREFGYDNDLKKTGKNYVPETRKEREDAIKAKKAEEEAKRAEEEAKRAEEPKEEGEKEKPETKDTAAAPADESTADAPSAKKRKGKGKKAKNQ